MVEYSKRLRILFIGDIFGEAGRKAVSSLLPNLVRENEVDFVIANCENAAGGKGVTPKLVEFLLNCGINVLTSGNHIWDRKEIIPYIGNQPRLLRPANFPRSTPGNGYGVFETALGYKIGVINLCGNLFMDSYDHPFFTASDLVEQISKQTNIVIVDFHAEATSEKIAMGWYLDGKVSAVVGTHTHVQTADERILANGTAYITDIGMTGPMNSVIGMNKEKVITRFLTLMPQKFEPAREDIWLHGVIIDLDPDSGKGLAIRRVAVPLGDSH
ncbi:hypothetical protein HRbin37_02220 [bacterium HR37]|nr:hypothetical protein HRbin37_02220 [bacterium HR37]